jgi:putative holliday junction resolvase
VDEYEVELVLVGLPLSLDGSEGPQARAVRHSAKRLAGFLRVPLEFADERLSSAAASRAMAETGVSSRSARGSVDMVAAAIFLQGFLDARRNAEQIGAD